MRSWLITFNVTLGIVVFRPTTERPIYIVTEIAQPDLYRIMMLKTRTENGIF